MIELYDYICVATRRRVIEVWIWRQICTKALVVSLSSQCYRPNVLADFRAAGGDILGRHQKIGGNVLL